MSRLRSAAAGGAALLLAVLLQVGLLAGLPLPGATPDLLLVVVAATAIARGPAAGAIAGFAGGLLVDLAPPSMHTAGQWALVLTLAGYLAGFLGDPRLRRGPRLLLVGGLAGLSTLAYVGLAGLLGDGWPSVPELAVLGGSAAAYAAVLGLVVIPAATWLLDRTAARPRTAW